MIKDRYGNELKKPDHEPTLHQSINSWALTNELIELGYCHNFQYERSDIADYIYQVSALVDKALAIKEENEKEKKEEIELELAEHCVGYDYAEFPKLYTRHERKFFKPYRNYFGCGKGSADNEYWHDMKSQGYADSWKNENYECATYYMTRKGLDWLGEHLKIIIKDCE